MALENNKSLYENFGGFDPFLRRQTEQKETSFLTNARDLLTNSAFGIVDSALFGVPSMIMEANKTTTIQDEYSSPESSYGAVFDILGIKPIENASTAGRIGSAVGNALGFFVPFGFISKGVKAAQYGMIGAGRLSKVAKEVGTNAVEIATRMSVKGGNIYDTGLIASSVAKTVKQYGKSGIFSNPVYNSIYKSSADDILNFESAFRSTIKINLQKELAENVTRTGVQLTKGSAQMIDDIAENTVSMMRKAGKEGKFVDNMEDLIRNPLESYMGLNKDFSDLSLIPKSLMWAAKTSVGATVRAADSAVSMIAYDFVQNSVRQLANSSLNLNQDVEEYNFIKSVKDSSSFMGMMSIADIIPGGKIAKNTTLMKDLLMKNVGRKRDWSKYYDDIVEKTKREAGNISTEDINNISLGKLRQTVSLFSSFAKTSPKGMSKSEIMTGSTKKDLVDWLETNFESNRKDLVRMLLSETKSSVIKSIPRGIADMLLTATYNSFSDDSLGFFEQFNDASSLTDMLVGGFMAMRAYDPINRVGMDGKSNVKYRYENGIDAKYAMMRMFGADSSDLMEKSEGMALYDRYLKFNYSSRKTSTDNSNIINAIKSVVINPNDKDSNDALNLTTEQRAKREFLFDVVSKIYGPDVLQAESEDKKQQKEDVNNLIPDSKIPNVYSLTNNQIEQYYNAIKDIEMTATGKKIGEYIDNNQFSEFYEDFNKPIMEQNKDSHLQTINEFLQLAEINVEKDVSSGDLATNKIIIPNIVLTKSDNQYANYVKNLINVAISNKWVGTADKTETIDLSKLDQAKFTELQANVKQRVDKIKSEFYGDMDMVEYPGNLYNDPSIDMISNFSRLSVGNRLFRMFSNNLDPDRDDSASLNLNSALNNLIGEQVHPDADIRIELDKSNMNDKQKEEATAEELQINSMISSMVKMRIKAGEVNSNNNRTKVIKGEDADRAKSLINSLVDANWISKNEEGIFYGHMSEDQMEKKISDLRMKKIGLNEEDFLSYKVLESAGRVQDGKLTFLSRDSFNSYLQVNNLDKGVLLDAYDMVFSRMSKTGMVDFTDSTVFDTEDRNIIDAIKTASVVYSSNINYYAGKIVNDNVTDIGILDTVFKGIQDLNNRIAQDSMGNQAGVNALKIDEIINIIGNSSERFKELSSYIEKIRELAANGDVNNLSRLLETISQSVDERVANLKEINGISSNLINSRINDFIDASTAISLKNRLMALLSKDDKSNIKNIDEAVDKLIRDGKLSQALDVYRDTRVYQMTMLSNSAVNVERDGDASLFDRLNEILSKEVHSSASANFKRKFHDLEINGIKVYKNGKFTSGFADKISGNDASSFVGEIANEIQKRNNGAINDDDLQGLASAIISIRLRSQDRKISVMEGGKIIHKIVKSSATHLSSFASDVEKNTQGKVESSVIKKSIIREDGQQKSVYDYESIEQLEQELNSKIVYDEVDAKNTGVAPALKDDAKILGNARKKIHVFVPIQNAEETGILLSFKDEADRDEYFKSAEAEALQVKVEAGRIDATNKANGKTTNMEQYISSIVDGRKNTDPRDLEVLVRFNYMRSLYGDAFLSMFNRDIDADSLLDYLSKGSKSIKYTHITSNKNAFQLDNKTASMLSSVYSKMNSNNAKEAALALDRRLSRGIRIATFNDEVKTGDVKQLTAKDTVKAYLTRIGRDALQLTNTDLDNFVDRNMKELVESNSDEEIKTITQGILDGIVFGSTSAVRLDNMLMGSSFEEGATVSKILIQKNHSSGTSKNGILVKSLISFHSSISKQLEDAGIDYLVPSTSMKMFNTWDNKVVGVKNFNADDSLSKIVDSRLIRNANTNGLNYDIDAIHYLFAGHDSQSDGNRNPSFTHGLKIDALNDYTKTLKIQDITTYLNAVAMAASNGSEGIKNRLLAKLKDINEGQYEGLSTAEILMDLGMSTNDSAIKSMILRQIGKDNISKILSRPDSSITTDFIVANHKLNPTIYGRTTGSTQQYVKLLGEVRLPDSKRNSLINLDESSVVFRLRGKNQEIQDFIFSLDKKENDILGEDNEGFMTYSEEIKNALFVIKNEIRKNPKIKTLGHLYSVLDSYNSKKGEKSKEFTDAIALLESKGITMDKFEMTETAVKIPKKYMADNVIGRMNGFLRKEDGNRIEVNNYDIAVNHQADQDGDKINIYSNVPFSAMKDNFYNMPTGKSFENYSNKSSNSFLFNNITENNTLRNPKESFIGASEVSTNNTSKSSFFGHLKEVEQSRNVIGTVAKMQGVITMMANASPSGVKGNFFTDLLADKDAMVAFNKRFISSIQPLLDVYNGIQSDLLNAGNIKRFILFGSPLPNGITKAPLEKDGEYKPLIDITKIMANNSIEDSDDNRKIMESIFLESYSVFEKAYSTSGDKFEDGAREDMSFEDLSRIYYDMEAFAKNPSLFMYNRMSRKYSYQLKSSNQNRVADAKNKLAGLRKIFYGDATESSFSKQGSATTVSNKPIRNILGMNQVDRLMSSYPHLAALKGIVTNAAALSLKDDYEYSNDDIDRVLTGVRDFDGTETMSLTSEQDTMLLTLGIGKSLRDKIYVDISKNSAEAVYQHGIIQWHAEKKLAKFKKDLHYYTKNRMEEEIKDTEDKISAVKADLEEFNKQYIHSAGEKNNFKIAEPKNGFFRGLEISKTDRRVYEIKDGELKLVEIVRAGQKSFKAKVGMIVSTNPLTAKKSNKETIREGFALQRSLGTLDSSINNDFYISIVNGTESSFMVKVQQFKKRINEVYSNGMEDFIDHKGLASHVFGKRSTDLFAISREIDEFIREQIKTSGHEPDSVIDAFTRLILETTIEDNAYTKVNQMQLPVFKKNNNVIKFMIGMIGENSGIESSPLMKHSMMFIMGNYKNNINKSKGIESNYMANSSDISTYLQKVSKSSLFEYWMTNDDDRLNPFLTSNMKRMAIQSGDGVSVKIDYKTESAIVKFLSDKDIKENQTAKCQLSLK